MSNAVEKLTACVIKMFKESPEARKAMRELLDELELEGRNGCIDADASKRMLFFEGVRARFDADPKDYKWKLERVINRNHAIFEREFKFGPIKLRYYFSSGTIQLVYPKYKHPQFRKDFEDAARNNGSANLLKVEQIVENFFDLSEQSFKDLLVNAPIFFGRGQLEVEEKRSNKLRRRSISPSTAVENTPNKVESEMEVIKIPYFDTERGLVRSFYDTNPLDHHWMIEKVADSKHAIYEREFKKFGPVELRYYFTTGTVQLVYPKWKHPAYAEGEGLGYSMSEDGGYTIPRIVENFRNLTEVEFEKLLNNAPNFFGKGYIHT